MPHGAKTKVLQDCTKASDKKHNKMQQMAASMRALGSTGCECKNKGEPLLLLLLLPNYDDHLATATLLLPLLRCRSIVMLMPTALYCHCQCYSAALLQAIAMRTLLFLCILRCTEIHILCAIPQPFLLKACPAN